MNKYCFDNISTICTFSIRILWICLFINLRYKTLMLIFNFKKYVFQFLYFCFHFQLKCGWKFIWTQYYMERQLQRKAKMHHANVAQKNTSQSYQLYTHVLCGLIFQRKFCDIHFCLCAHLHLLLFSNICAFENNAMKIK